jgi:hypothetical protein
MAAHEHPASATERGDPMGTKEWRLGASIRRVREAYGHPEWIAWADAWLDGRDRSPFSAARAARVAAMEEERSRHDTDQISRTAAVAAYYASRATLEKTQGKREWLIQGANNMALWVLEVRQGVDKDYAGMKIFGIDNWPADWTLQ